MVTAWYHFFHPLLRWLGSILLTRARVSGRSHIPSDGPFFLVANHESMLDPLLVQTNCPRPVHFFTKSTQFSSGWAMRWFLPRVAAIPARRYRVDPQSVRTALRVLDAGGGVGIYLEGERSWEGAMQPFRRGAVRLILKAGAPVVPCGVSGTYEAWPRWSRRCWRRRVFVRYGEPLRFGVHDTRPERERALDDAAARMAEAIERLRRPPARRGARAGPRRADGARPRRAAGIHEKKGGASP